MHINIIKHITFFFSDLKLKQKTTFIKLNHVVRISFLKLIDSVSILTVSENVSVLIVNHSNIFGCGSVI